MVPVSPGEIARARERERSLANRRRNDFDEGQPVVGLLARSSGILGEASQGRWLRGTGSRLRSALRALDPRIVMRVRGRCRAPKPPQTPTPSVEVEQLRTGWRRNSKH
jgi:hypothetical protein